VVLLDMGEEAGVGIVNIDREAVAAARGRIPVLQHRRAIPAVSR
jgi:predicted amidohydrolase